MRREQLGVSITLVFGLASAALGYCGSLLTANHAQFGGCATCAYLLATGVFFLTVLLSVAATITRLLDFRFTARKLRLEGRGKTTAAEIERLKKTGTENGAEIERLTKTAAETAAEVNRLKKLASCLGKCTWKLFCCQISGFCFGVFILLVALSKIFHQRLFP